MKKRIRKHTGEAAAVLFTLLFLCGNWGNCQKVFGADVEKTELCDGTEIAELCDGEKHLQEEMNIDGQQAEKDKEYTEEWKEVGEENREEDAEKAEEIQNPLMLSLSGEPVLKAGEAAVYEVALKNAGEEKLSDLILTAEFSCPKVTWQWQEAPGLDMQEERSVLSVLEPGQETLLFLTAQLQPEQKEPLTCTVTASMEGGFSSEAVCVSETEPLKADFSVEKIADRSVAVAGEEIFYEYDHIPVPQGEEIAQTLSKLSGYQLVKNAGLYSHGGLKDWFIKEFHRPGFTVEIGKGENPLPLSDLDPIYQKIRRMMAAAVIL